LNSRLSPTMRDARSTSPVPVYSYFYWDGWSGNSARKH